MREDVIVTYHSTRSCTRILSCTICDEFLQPLQLTNERGVLFLQSSHFLFQLTFLVGAELHSLFQSLHVVLLFLSTVPGGRLVSDPPPHRSKHFLLLTSQRQM